jgi:hypothetical protein
MTDHVHLDELVLAETAPMARKLLETFRALVRDPALGAADYGTRLKTVMEEFLQEEAANAPSESNNP